MAIPENDGNLDRATEVEGYKVLPPCVLYGKIGQGGMGAVYRGRHLNLDIDVAVKCLKPGLVGTDDQFVVRFRREARSAAQINHQNVIRVYDVAEDQGLHYLIMELVQGETARERVVRKQRLGVGEALEIVYGAAQGLAEAHRKGFIHRDIKPDNIMISSSGQVKVADLGLAKPSIRDDHASLLSGTNLVMGTPQYMPPEQWENTTTVTAAADVWALGATLYYLLVGGEAIQKDSLPRIMQRIMLQPFPDPRKVRPDVPDDVAALIAKATATAVADRFQNAQELADAIDGLSTRRTGLKDKEAVPTSKVDGLVSPPPAKTLAKIKFWLDKQGQDGAAEAATKGPDGTMVVKSGTEVLQPLTLAPKSRKPLAAAVGGLAVVVIAILFALKGGGRTGMFAEVDRLEATGKYEEAIEETTRIYTSDPSLPGRGERLGKLTSSLARELAMRGEWREALVQLERSRAHNDSTTVRQQRADLLDRIRAALESKFVREQPGSAPIATDEARGVRFVARLADPIVASVRIGGVTATLQDGVFQATVDMQGKANAPVEVTLTTGDALALAPWAITHAGPTPVLPVASLVVSPESITLDDDKPVELSIRVARGAAVTVDGAAQRVGDDGTVRFQVRSTEDRPRAIEVVVRQAGCVDATKTVLVQRASRSWQLVRAIEIQGARSVGNQMVTKEATVRLVGRASERGTSLTINGSSVDTKWSDNGTFECQVSLPAKGANVLHVALQKALRPMLTQDVTIVLVGDPSLALAPPSKDGDVTSGSTYMVMLSIDPWIEMIAARRGGVLIKSVDVPVGSTAARIEVGLLPGENVLELEAVNVVGQRRTLRSTITRNAGPGTGDTTGGTGGEAAPPITRAPDVEAVFVLEERGERLVARNQTTRVRSNVRFRVAATDPKSAIVCNGREIAADECFFAPGAGIMKDARGGRIEVRARNDVGASRDAFVFRIEIDDEAPTFAVKGPTGAVGTGKPFVCYGTWNDNCAVVSITINGQPAKGADPKSPKGTFSIELPAIDGPVEYEAVFTDEAGNVRRETVSFAP